MGLIPKYDGPFWDYEENWCYGIWVEAHRKVEVTLFLSCEFLKTCYEDSDPIRRQAKQAPPNKQKKFDHEIASISKAQENRELEKQMDKKFCSLEGDAREWSKLRKQRNLVVV